MSVLTMTTIVLQEVLTMTTIVLTMTRPHSYSHLYLVPRMTIVCNIVNTVVSRSITVTSVSGRSVAPIVKPQFAAHPMTASTSMYLLGNLFGNDDDDDDDDDDSNGDDDGGGGGGGLRRPVRWSPRMNGERRRAAERG